MKFYPINKKVEYRDCPRCDAAGCDGSGHVTAAGGISCFRCGYVTPEEVKAYDALMADKGETVMAIVTSISAAFDAQAGEWMKQAEQEILAQEELVWLVAEVPPDPISTAEPETIGEAVAVAFGSAKWYHDLPMIDPETLEEVE